MTCIVEGASTTIAKEPVMTNKLDVVSVVAMFDAINANCVPIGSVARAASGDERKGVN